MKEQINRLVAQEKLYDALVLLIEADVQDANIWLGRLELARKEYRGGYISFKHFEKIWTQVAQLVIDTAPNRKRSET